MCKSERDGGVIMGEVIFTIVQKVVMGGLYVFTGVMVFGVITKVGFDISDDVKKKKKKAIQNR